jgi:DNA-binding NarL/FixJ family response regulator
MLVVAGRRDVTGVSTVPAPRIACHDRGMTRPSILIVDDHQPFRAQARDMLAQAGFDVIGEAVDGRGALSSVDRLRPSVVLLDVQLPDLDGFEVTRQLLARAEPPVVVLVSTRDASDYGRRIHRSGAQGFITKSRLSGDTLHAVLPESNEGV